MRQIKTVGFSDGREEPVDPADWATWEESNRMGLPLIVCDCPKDIDATVEPIHRDDCVPFLRAQKRHLLAQLAALARAARKAHPRPDVPLVHPCDLCTLLDEMGE